jgi:ABC-type molybdate transport system substrate-binding protein
MVLLAAVAATSAATAQEAVTVHAAGSLRGALTELAQAFEAQTQRSVKFSFGASGLLKDRLLGGERSEVFASANMEHPQALVAAGRAQAVLPFASNALCALAAPGFALNGKTLAARLLDADVKLGTSTPRADPSGDYAWQMFDRIEASGAAPAGSSAALKARALQLTGGPSSPPPPTGRNVYGVLVAEGQADVFITYCTNATLALREQPQLKVLPVPQAINVAAQYGLALVEPSSEGARAFVAFLLGPRGQVVLTAHGFGAP